MRQTTLGVMFIVVALCTFAFVLLTTSRNVAMILVNGTVYTLDGQNTVAEALAIRDGRIVAVGTNDAIRNRYSTETVVDLHGNAVLPGFIDAHCHVLGQ